MVVSLIYINGGESPVNQRIAITMMHILTYNRPFHKTVLRPMPYSLCTVPVSDLGSGQKLESLDLYDYLILFQYPWFYVLDGLWH